MIMVSLRKQKSTIIAALAVFVASSAIIFLLLPQHYNNIDSVSKDHYYHGSSEGDRLLRSVATMSEEEAGQPQTIMTNADERSIISMSPPKIIMPSPSADMTIIPEGNYILYSSQQQQ